MSGPDEAEVDRAIEVVDHVMPVIGRDDVYPWWNKLKVPALLFGAAMILMATSTAALVIDDILDDRAGDRQRAEEAERQEIERQRSDCSNAYDQLVAGAAQATRAAAAALNASEALGLLTFIPGGGPPEA